MSIISRKKKSILPTGDDYKTLDSSVDDLSKQTSELLSHFGETKLTEDKSKESSATKPANLKRRPAKAGKSFDIIAAPSKKSVVKKRPAVIKADQDEELLPEHASKSFNEPGYEEMVPKESINTGEIQASGDDKITEEAPVEISSAITSKPPGSLHFQQADSESENTTNLVDEKEEPTGEEENETNNKLEPSSQTVIAPLTNGDNAKDAEEVDSGTDQTNRSESKNAEEDETTISDQETILSEKDTDTGELYVNNLVKTTDKNGYVAPEGQQKPTVFDTNEYHPQLHDWSKLENKNGVKGYFLALLLVVAGALAYLILSGIEIPFIGKIF